MLYLSRYILPSGYGVVDTEDDVEDIVTRDEIRQAVLKYGLEIKGVEAEPDFLSGRRIKFATVYQDPATYTVAQTKLRTLTGVDVRIFRNAIVFIKLEHTVKDANVHVRLSSLAPKLDENVHVARSSMLPNTTSLTLVFDDNISINGPIRQYADWVCFDLTELNLDSVADTVYKSLLATSLLPVDEFDRRVTDIDRRKDLWRCVCLVCSSAVDAEKYQDYAKRFERGSLACERIENMFFWEWAEMTNSMSDQVFFSSLTPEEFVKSAKDILEIKNLSCGKSDDYDYLRQNFISVFTLLRITTTINSMQIMRFENYVRYFDVSDSVKELFVELCHNVYTSISSFCKKSNISLEE